MIQKEHAGGGIMRFFVEHERYAMVLRQIADGHRYSTIEGAVKAAKGAFNKE